MGCATTGDGLYEGLWRAHCSANRSVGVAVGVCRASSGDSVGVSIQCAIQLHHPRNGTSMNAPRLLLIEKCRLSPIHQTLPYTTDAVSYCSVYLVLQAFHQQYRLHS